MTAYAEAQSRLTDARRRGDSRAVHHAIVESKRLMTQGLREKFKPETPVQEPPTPPKRIGRLTAYAQWLIGDAT